MNHDNSTSQLPSEEVPAASSTVLPLTEIGNSSAQWTLALHPSHLALTDSPGAQPYILLRDAMMKSAVLMMGMQTFAITEPRKLTFKLSAEATDALAEWIGKSVVAATYLRQRYAFVLPIAVIWILGSLPLFGKSPEALPFDPVSFGLGSTLVIMWAFARWRPHPALFLVDSFWFFALAASLIVDVAKGGNKGWLVLVVLLLWMVVSGVKHFARFRGTRITPISL